MTNAKAWPKGASVSCEVARPPVWTRSPKTFSRCPFRSEAALRQPKLWGQGCYGEGDLVT
ncbi:hypothetical protein Tdes44962_MAKER04255 [Teratosphaeria destructans]|uniref:Uncharacterized protein n=1 Tax=Teratosphaeria destructans TaxID=418781 RepID=A0A9W7W0M8_9PEZI|nr:hypothetical protein Tdes44962_MAKER04255 [Teratosphaeria destructans]